MSRAITSRQVISAEELTYLSHKLHKILETKSL